MKFEKIKPGMRLWDLRVPRGIQHLSGGSGCECYAVDVIEVNAKRRMALVSWNHNPPMWLCDLQVTGYRANKPCERKATKK